MYKKNIRLKACWSFYLQFAVRAIEIGYFLRVAKFDWLIKKNTLYLE